MKAGDFVRIQPCPADHDPDIDYTFYDGYVAEISDIEDGYAALFVPEKMIMLYKPPFVRAPLVQLKVISKEDALQQVEEAKKAKKESLRQSP